MHSGLSISVQGRKFCSMDFESSGLVAHTLAFVQGCKDVGCSSLSRAGGSGVPEEGFKVSFSEGCISYNPNIRGEVQNRILLNPMLKSNTKPMEPIEDRNNINQNQINSH